MKRTYNIVIFFFIFAVALIFSFMSKASFDCVQHSVNPSGYIQDIKRETIVLLSNSTKTSTISSRKQKNNTGFSNIYPFFVNLKQDNNILIADSQNFNVNYTFNLSNNIKEAHKIRAP